MSQSLNYGNMEKLINIRIEEANKVLSEQIQELKLEIFLLKKDIVFNDSM